MEAGCRCVASKRSGSAGRFRSKKQPFGFSLGVLSSMSDPATRNRARYTQARPGSDSERIDFINNGEAGQVEVYAAMDQCRLRCERSFQGFLRWSLLRARDRATGFPFDQLGGNGDELWFLTGIGNAVEDHLDHLLA